MDAGLGRSAAVDSTLAALVRDRGAAAWTDPKTTSEYLRAEVCGESGLIDTLIAAAEIGLVADMAAMPGRDSMREAQLAQRLVVERYYSDSDARFAVEAWARALWEPAAPAAAPAPAPAPPASSWPGPPSASQAAPTPRRHVSMPAPAPPPMDFAQAPRRYSTPRAGGKGCFAALSPIIIVFIVLFVLSGWVSQCNNSDSGSSGGPDSATESSQSYNEAESYALDNLNYTDASSVTASDVVSGLGEAPASTRSFIASYAAQPANAELSWIAIGDENNSTGYLALRSGDSGYEKRIAILRTSDGTYSLSGPDWTGNPGR